MTKVSAASKCKAEGRDEAEITPDPRRGSACLPRRAGGMLRKKFHFEVARHPRALRHCRWRRLQSRGRRTCAQPRAAAQLYVRECESRSAADAARRRIVVFRLEKCAASKFDVVVADPATRADTRRSCGRHRLPSLPSSCAPRSRRHLRPREASRCRENRTRLDEGTVVELIGDAVCGIERGVWANRSLFRARPDNGP